MVNLTGAGVLDGTVLSVWLREHNLAGLFSESPVLTVTLDSTAPHAPTDLHVCTSTGRASPTSAGLGSSTVIWFQSTSPTLKLCWTAGAHPGGSATVEWSAGTPGNCRSTPNPAVQPPFAGAQLVPSWRETSHRYSRVETTWDALADAKAACSQNSLCTAVYELNGKYMIRYCSQAHMDLGWCNDDDAAPICDAAQGGVTYFKLGLLRQDGVYAAGGVDGYADAESTIRHITWELYQLSKSDVTQRVLKVEHEYSKDESRVATADGTVVVDFAASSYGDLLHGGWYELDVKATNGAELTSDSVWTGAFLYDATDPDNTLAMATLCPQTEAPRLDLRPHMNCDAWPSPGFDEHRHQARRNWLQPAAPFPAPVLKYTCDRQPPPSPSPLPPLSTLIASLHVAVRTGQLLPPQGAVEGLRRSGEPDRVVHAPCRRHQERRDVRFVPSGRGRASATHCSQPPLTASASSSLLNLALPSPVSCPLLSPPLILS